jgi:signal peptidase I
MLSTIIVISLVLGLIPLLVVLWAVFPRLGLAWARVADVTTRRIVVATATVIAFQIVLKAIFHFLTPTSNIQSFLFSVIEIAATVVVPCFVITRVFRASWLRSIQAWLMTLLVSAAAFGFSLFVLRPFIYEAFYMPTNAMAPTLLGRHWQGVCPQCGQPNYCTPGRSQGDPTPREMICRNFHVSETSRKDFPVSSADHFLVAKFLAPRRWDLVVFRLPENPSQLYVKRLVGLPGETIHIEGGAIWVNGERLTPPDSLRGIEYLSELPSFYRDLSGTSDNPAILGDDEYFVLGDFSAQSSDSRVWELGAPDHHPYAVPRSYMQGIVTHIHWPPQRWRIFR